MFWHKINIYIYLIYPVYFPRTFRENIWCANIVVVAVVVVHTHCVSRVLPGSQTPDPWVALVAAALCCVSSLPPWPPSYVGKAFNLAHVRGSSLSA